MGLIIPCSSLWYLYWFRHAAGGGVKGYKVEEKETLELARQIWKDETKDIEGLIRVGKK